MRPGRGAPYCCPGENLVFVSSNSVFPGIGETTVLGGIIGPVSPAFPSICKAPAAHEEGSAVVACAVGMMLLKFEVFA